MAGPFMEGHNPRSDYMFGQNPDDDGARQWETAQKLGYIGTPGETVGQGGVNAPATQDWSPTGQGNAISGGYMQPGTSAYDADVNRQRTMGAAGQGRPAAQIAQGPQFQSRMVQMGALGMLGRAAAGGAPSKAVIQGGIASDAAARQGTATMAGARGPGQSVAAFRNAGGAVAASDMNTGAGVAAGRAGEISRDQNAYLKGGLQMRAGDIGLATNQAQLDASQRALDEQRQQNFERRAFDTRHQQQQAAVDYQKIQDAADQDWARREDEWDALERQRFNTGLGVATGAGAAGAEIVASSDERTKCRVGSLSDLHKYMRR